MSVVQKGMGYGMYLLVLPFFAWMIVLVVSLMNFFALVLFGFVLQPVPVIVVLQCTAAMASCLCPFRQCTLMLMWQRLAIWDLLKVGLP